MCGIFLFFDEPKYANENLIYDIFNDIKRRGPDESNLLHLDNLTIGHSRLSLVDLGEGGRQPKQDKNKDIFYLLMVKFIIGLNSQKNIN